MAGQRKTPKAMRAAARRLLLTRLAFGQERIGMSQLIGSNTPSGQAWENYESGRRLISVTAAMMLCRRLPVTLDWLYMGKLDSLPARTQRALRRLPRNPKVPRRKRRDKTALDNQQDVDYNPRSVEKEGLE